MVSREEFTYDSGNHESKIYAVYWKPEGEPRAILQLVHGMQERIERYDEFARYMAGKGYLVAGEDHLGHGKSVGEGETYGYFCKKDAPGVLVDDVNKLRTITQRKYPDIPIIILGHSFGSYILREYITRYPAGLDGVIIQGTGIQKESTVNLAIVLATIIQFFCGSKHRSALINKIAFGGYLDKIPDAKTPSDWFSHNDESIKAYLEDPMCNARFTMNGFLTLGSLIKSTQNLHKMEAIPKTLPIMLASGVEDPVGNYGESVKELYDIYKNQLRLMNVELKLYEGMRHEILQETDRTKVFDDFDAWISKITKER